MDPELFTSDAFGQLVRTPEGYTAFVPEPPPRGLDLSKEAILLLDEASNGLGILNGIGRRLPNPHLLIAPYLRREAVLSSRIEGTQTTISDLYAAEAGQFNLVESPDVREVANYVAAHAHGLERLDTLPLSLRFIRELHARLMEDVRGHSQQPGRFRTYQNWIGAQRAEDASYVPPPVVQMKERLNDFEKFLHVKGLPPLVQAAILHYEFEAIHPFGDGNGRVGRLLIPIFLNARGLLPEPLLYLSAYFERSRRRYYDGLMRVSTHGDWDGWVRYFLEAVRVQAQEAADLADRLLALQSQHRQKLHGRHATANALALSDELFESPIIDASGASEALGVSLPTARSTIRMLEEAEILREITGRNWGRVYRADAIIELLRG